MGKIASLLKPASSALLICTATLVSGGFAYAEEVVEEDAGLMDFTFGKGKAQIFEPFGITWGGWINGSVTYNSTDPEDRFNGPVTFGDRSGEPQMNQLNLWMQKAVTVGGDSFDWGWRFDFMYGSDAIFTQAYGVPAVDPTTGRVLDRGTWDLNLIDRDTRFYGIAIPQAYFELNLPVGNGLDLKLGHFYTPIGYETVPAPDNFFFSKPYTFQYGEPFTHTGILGSYTIDDNWSVMAGGVTGSATGGWDGSFDQQLGAWSFLGGVNWVSTDKAYALGMTASAGPRSDDVDDIWAIYSIVGKANFMENKLHYVFQHDHGFADNVFGVDAEWYGINQYLMYDIWDNLGIGVRGEWFRDRDGFRVAGPARCGASTNVVQFNPLVLDSYACRNNAALYPLGAADYFEVTLGLNYKPVKWAMVRPNVRYDWVDGIDAFDTGGRTNQFLFSTDLVITF
jgi:hypothetical protein